MNDFVPLCVPSVGPEELEFLARCINDNFVSSVGPFVTQFEEDFAAFVGAEYAVATSSGTAALHVAMVSNDIGPDDLVAISDFTFIASANAARYTGASILLVDSEPETWNLDGQMLYDAVHARAARGEPIPTAVEVVHILGHPARLEPILALRDEFGMTLIEDAAESLGATYSRGSLAGQQVGTVAPVGAFSFNGNKIITTGSGGILVTDDAELALRARHLTTQAKLDGPGYFHDEVGYNYRMSNVTAALGVAQLRKLPDFLSAKRRLARRYDELLDADAFERPPATDFADPSCWLYTVRVKPDHRDALIDGLREAGIQARTVWPPLRQQAPYADCETMGSGIGAAIHRGAVSLPSSVDLSDEDLERIATAANAVMRKSA